MMQNATRTENSLDHCTRCGGRLDLVGGTDPDVAGERGGFKERYECEQCGCVGHYEYVYGSGTGTFRGACRGEEAH